MNSNCIGIGTIQISDFLLFQVSSFKTKNGMKESSEKQRRQREIPLFLLSKHSLVKFFCHVVYKEDTNHGQNWGEVAWCMPYFTTLRLDFSRDAVKPSWGSQNFLRFHKRADKITYFPQFWAENRVISRDLMHCCKVEHLLKVHGILHENHRRRYVFSRENEGISSQVAIVTVQNCNFTTVFTLLLLCTFSSKNLL